MFGMDVSKASLINQRCAALLKALQEKLKRASAGYRDACPEREREREERRGMHGKKKACMWGEKRVRGGSRKVRHVW